MAGNEAENLDVEEIESTDEDVNPEGTGEAEAPEEEIVIGLEGEDTLPQNDVPKGFLKRIEKLNNKVDAAKADASSVAEELALERERRRLLELALEQQKQPTGPPNPNDFADGVADPEYLQKQAEFTQHQINQALAERPAPEPQADPNIERNQIAHYERAAALGVKDYAEIEDKAIEVLGQDITNTIIQSCEDDSEKVLLYLGKNPDKAEELRRLAETNPLKGVLHLGALRSKIVVKRNAKSAPDPDEEIQGGAATPSEHAQSKLDQLREKAGKTGDLSPVLAFKKKMAAEGVHLE